MDLRPFIKEHGYLVFNEINNQLIGNQTNMSFIDSLENDIDNLVRVNEALGMLANEAPHFKPETLKPIDMLVIRPSIDLDDLAAHHIQDLPFGLRRVLKAMGASTKGGGGSLASYLLFEAAFCRELITCGYEDAMRDHIAIKDFFDLSE